MNDGEIISHADIMEWDPPAFDCPKGHEKVVRLQHRRRRLQIKGSLPCVQVCNFVEAYTPFFLQTLSCGLHTPTECTTDPSCTFHFESGCTAAVRVFLQLDQEAEFVRPVHDGPIIPMTDTFLRCLLKESKMQMLETLRRRLPNVYICMQKMIAWVRSLDSLWLKCPHSLVIRSKGMSMA